MVASLGGSIDVHHHILPPEYINALAGMGITRSIGVPFPKWSVEEDLEQMDRLGVRIAVVSFSTPAANVPGTENAENARVLARLCNELMGALVKAYPDRYGGFATRHGLSFRREGGVNPVPRGSPYRRRD